MPSHDEVRARSWLFTPATRPERFAKALAAGADVLIVDLEDSVASKDKASARAAALEFLQAPAGAILHALRLNSLDTLDGLADLQAFLGSGADPAFLIAPKTDSTGHVQILDRLLSRSGKKARLVAQIETAQGLSHAEGIACAAPRLTALMFGTADLAADLGADMSWDSLLYARSRMVAAAAISGLLAIDAPFFDLTDPTRLAHDTARAAALGFSGKAAIHPGQLASIHAALPPSDLEVAHARAVLEENVKGVGVVDGIMVDEAVARRARRVLARVGRREAARFKKPS